MIVIRNSLSRNASRENLQALLLPRKAVKNENEEDSPETGTKNQCEHSLQQPLMVLHRAWINTRQLII